MDEVSPVAVTRYQEGRCLGERDDVVATEEPLEIRVEGQTMAIVMRTPGADRELTAGFLLSEGIVKSAKEIFDIASCVPPGGSGQAIDVALADPRAFDPEKFTRHVFTSSSCGVCGKTTIEAVLKRRRPLRKTFAVPASVVFGLPARLLGAQSNFQRTGGLHACALFDAKGTMLSLCEDVGRHNALDKLIGRELLAKRTPLSRQIVLLSGRSSFEMLQKAYSGGIAIVVAIGAPSSLAVEFARESGQTLVGFLRGKTMNVYAGEERVLAKR